ncbi:serine hydrolase domain-containing protein [Paenibacillus flagellatus]|uniref:Serine hydrolase n=1 Tax=Paenibacillus flagellatus TaxID=2211139 RepID=A0A2V5KES2_9BACL|nr:serine hydrolase [Paenibacillus flagellatus]PYI52500.1 serine hydrolase [Paenibacillus flagellatus]
MERLNPFPIDIPDNHGLSSAALSRFFDKIEQHGLPMNSFMLLQDGHVTARMWRTPYRPDRPQLLYSLSKSVTSIAVGIAVDSGYVKLEDPVIQFFPERCPEKISDNLANMTVHHLLSMNTGHSANIYKAVTGEKDWVRSFLSLEVQFEPGSHYSYNTPATYMLSAILERATGQHLVDFLMPRLFEPLGIERPVWETCPMGIAAGGMGLSLTTESVAKFGQMLLDKGKVDGKTIVSESYVARATREQSDNRRGATEIDSAQGYGYQFHLGRRGCFRGAGAFGQLCFVVPEQRIVIAATAAFGKGQSQTLLDLIYEHIIDEWNGSHTARLHTGDSAVLRQRLAGLKYPVPDARPIPVDLPSLDGVWYRLEDNPEKLDKLGFARLGERLEVRLCYGERERRALVLDFRAPLHQFDRYVKDLAIHRQEVVAFAGWDDGTTLNLTLLYIETPYCVNYKIRFQAGGMDLHFHKNVSMTFTDYRVSGFLVSS